ncbi:NUDIX hydrolase [Terrimonas pollutisoli]|uniref:NUDIX hydrolase n=1 Tax=Terrimonas pollutisoli TaxID=3034147 RepID=UPI0023EDFF8C|nr:NUDIX domain-containing protein [Terrimonas sp. H1YJ31]
MPLRKYNETPSLVSVDCVIFGFDGQDIKLLLIHRGFEPEKGKWSLMGGFVQKNEGLNAAASRVLKQLTGLEGVYMEQLHAFGDPKRDPVERTISIVYFALIDIHQYEKQLSDNYKPEWFYLKELPHLIFDHAEMVDVAHQRLKYKAALHPILFELLSKKFTIPNLLTLYKAVYEKEFDKRNFVRKLASTGILIRQKDKEKHTSKKGAFYYKLDKRKYSNSLQAFMSLLPTKDIFK